MEKPYYLFRGFIVSVVSHDQTSGMTTLVKHFFKTEFTSTTKNFKDYSIELDKEDEETIDNSNSDDYQKVLSDLMRKHN